MKRIAVALLIALTACGGSAQKGAEVAPPVSPITDASDLLSPFSVTMAVRPAALAHDSVYGPIMRAALHAARSQGETPAAHRVLDVVATSESAEVGLTADRRAIAILEGVRGDLDPVSLGEGVNWVARGPIEFARDDEPSVCLFVPKARTWIFGMGDDSCARIRSRFQKSTMWRSKVADSSAPLLAADVSGDVLKRPALMRELPGATKARIVLQPGNGGIMLRVSFDTEDHANFAEQKANTLLTLIAKKNDRTSDPTAPTGPGAFAGLSAEWLDAVGIQREGSALELRAPLPKEFVERFVKVK